MIILFKHVNSFSHSGLRYDYPADPNAASVLVNNLDLTVRWRLILRFGRKSSMKITLP